MDYIARARSAVCIDWEYDQGGWEENYYIGESLDIYTKKGNRYLGILKGFKESEDEMTQDALILDFGEGEQCIGINSIVKIERYNDGDRVG